MLSLGDVLGTLKTLSSSFMLSYLFPALIFELGSLALYNYGILALPLAFPRSVSDHFLWPIIDLSFGALAISVFLSVSTGLMRQVLEGEFLPECCSRRLVARYDRELQAMLEDENAALAFAAEVRFEVDEAMRQLGEARSIGAKIHDTPSSVLVKRSSDAVTHARPVDVQQRSRRLDTRWVEARKRELLEWRRVTRLVKAALRANCADDEAVPSANQGMALLLDHAHMTWVRRLSWLADGARTLANITYSHRISRFALADTRPTRFGNQRAIMEAHPRNVYGVDFSYMWPRIQSQLDPTAPTSASLAKATTQLELALAFNVIIAAAAIAWPCALLACHLYVGFAFATALTPIAAWCGYQFALESQRILSGNVWAVIDRDRVKVLDAMHIAYPANSAQERQTWQALLQNSAGGRRSVSLEPKQAT